MMYILAPSLFHYWLAVADRSRPSTSEQCSRRCVPSPRSLPGPTSIPTVNRTVVRTVELKVNHSWHRRVPPKRYRVRLRERRHQRESLDRDRALHPENTRDCTSAKPLPAKSLQRRVAVRRWILAQWWIRWAGGSDRPSGHCSIIRLGELGGGGVPLNFLGRLRAHRSAEPPERRLPITLRIVPNLVGLMIHIVPLQTNAGSDAGMGKRQTSASGLAPPSRRELPSSLKIGYNSC